MEVAAQDGLRVVGIGIEHVTVRPDEFAHVAGHVVQAAGVGLTLSGRLRAVGSLRVGDVACGGCPFGRGRQAVAVGVPLHIYLRRRELLDLGVAVQPNALAVADADLVAGRQVRSVAAQRQVHVAEVGLPLRIDVVDRGLAFQLREAVGCGQHIVQRQVRDRFVLLVLAHRLL